ncbi:MAG TPA: transglycosylase domain-containing protein [Kineosporiaceae bacterium]
MKSASASASRAVALLGAFVTVSAVAGLMLAGLALPAAWATGSATRGGVDFFNSLPDDLAEPPLSEQSTVLDSTGRPIAHFYDERRILVPLTKISPRMQQAIIAIEDSRFYQHGGVDPKGLLRAFVTNQVNDGRVQGASTLTQQYIKLRILEQAVTNEDAAGQSAALAKNYTRKLQEVRMAVSLEKKKNKNDILEGYLNIANFGDSTYGVEAAAQYFFSGTSATDLTLPQAALLAGLVQSPQRYSPFTNPAAATNRRNVVLTRMHDLGVISDSEFQDAVKAPLGVKKNPPRNGCITSYYAYFCSYVRNLIVKSSAFSALGKTEEERSNTLKRGGLTIRTTLNENIQDVAQKAVEDAVPDGDKSQVGASAVTVEPGTGKVLAMVQNRQYDPAQKPGNTEINYAVDQDLGSGTGFQTGSTMKAITLATWLAKGKGLYDIVDATQTTRPFSDFEGCNGPLHSRTPWHYNNSERSETGPMTVFDATRNSVNTAFVDMASKLSLCDIAATGTKLGIHKAFAYDPGCEGKPTTTLPDCLPSMVLGSLQIAPMTMALAYGTFAADGTYCTPIAVASITDRDGKQLKVPASQCNQALDPNVAHGVTYAFKSVLTSGTAAGLGIGRPAAGKTGTTDNSSDTWFVGYTPQLSTAVWIGDNPNPANTYQRSLEGITIGGHYWGRVFGADIAAPIWQKIMKKGSEGLPEKDWPDPTGKVMTGSSVKVPDEHGRPVGDALADLRAHGFDAAVGDPVASDLGPDIVESTDPAAGSRAGAKSKVTIRPGNGQGKKQQDGPGGNGQNQKGQGGPGQHGPGQAGPGKGTASPGPSPGQ